MPACLDSVINQTYHNIEIILVDDGSTDSSGSICDEYANKYSRIVVIHQENTGVSIARNKALKLANGEFVCFVDSDDTITPFSIEKLVNGIENNDVDLIVANLKDIYNDKSSIVRIDSDVSGNIRMDYINIYKLVMGPVGKLYRTELINKHSITFPENIVIAEDQIFNYRFLEKIRKYSYVNSITYNYYHRDYMSLSKGMDSIHFENRLVKIKYEKEFFENNYIEGYTHILNDHALFYLSTAVAVCDRENSFNAFKNRLNKLYPFIDLEEHTNKLKRRILLFY